MFARGVVSLHTAHLPVQETSASKSPVSITSKLIQTKGLHLHYFGHLRKTGGEGGRSHFQTPVGFPHSPLPLNDFLMNSSGLFKARRAILSPLEAGPHPSWLGTDVAQRLSGPLYPWSRLHDLCALQTPLRRPPRRHRPPRRRGERSRSSGSRRTDFRPCQEKCSRPTGTGKLPGPRVPDTASRKLLSRNSFTTRIA
jgi:hypothetical protein